ncbi:unnamed protein product [Gadus morhua 'NCC']
MVIFDDLWEPFLSILKAKTFFSVLAVSATDVSTRDLKGVSASICHMIGRAKQCVQILKDYSRLLFVVLVQDILHV